MWGPTACPDPLQLRGALAWEEPNLTLGNKDKSHLGQPAPLPHGLCPEHHPELCSACIPCLGDSCKERAPHLADRPEDLQHCYIAGLSRTQSQICSQPVCITLKKLHFQAASALKWWTTPRRGQIPAPRTVLFTWRGFACSPSGRWAVGAVPDPTYLLYQSHQMAEAGEIKWPQDPKQILLPSTTAAGVCSTACPQGHCGWADLSLGTLQTAVPRTAEPR